MDNAAKARENRLRRMAERRGYGLSKSRRRDPLATGYGTWTLTDAATGSVIAAGLTLDAAAARLERKDIR
jgi:hypothetical protein